MRPGRPTDRERPGHVCKSILRMTSDHSASEERGVVELAAVESATHSPEEHLSVRAEARQPVRAVEWLRPHAADRPHARNAPRCAERRARHAPVRWGCDVASYGILLLSSPLRGRSPAAAGGGRSQARIALPPPVGESARRPPPLRGGQERSQVMGQPKHPPAPIAPAIAPIATVTPRVRTPAGHHPRRCCRPFGVVRSVSCNPANNRLSTCSGRHAASSSPVARHHSASVASIPHRDRPVRFAGKSAAAEWTRVAAGATQVDHAPTRPAKPIRVGDEPLSQTTAPTVLCADTNT